MMRSMFAAISGLKNHQTMMDVVGNNIANVNTTGFKQSRVTFQDILSQTVRGASGPQNGRGGVNAEQIGLGVVLGGIDTIQTQGTLQSTGKTTDMAIQGDGYFVMSDGRQNFFTRDGSFDLGTDGTLVNPASGLHVMGWQADALGVVNSSGPATTITIPVGAGMIGKASTNLSVTGNLNSNNGLLSAVAAPAIPAVIADPLAVPPILAAAAVPAVVAGVPVILSATVYDSLGNAVPITLTATKTGINTWDVVADTVPPNIVAGTPTPLQTATVTFSTDGKVSSVVPALVGGVIPTPPLTGTTIIIPLANGSTTPEEVSLDLTKMTQLASTSSLDPAITDGASAGSLSSFTVGQSGEVTGIYSNGFKQALGQIALGSFANPSGLVKAGGNLFQTSANSGAANIGAPATGSRGGIATGFLEGSNVDLAQQFTNMIMAERGFQANSKVITTSDEILQDLVNLKH
jgi:flagellar hook protein FlgE